MKLEFDSTEKPETLRAVAAFALMLAGDIDVPSLKDEEHVTTHDVATAFNAGLNVPREMILPPSGPLPIIGKNPYPNEAPNMGLDIKGNVVNFPTAGIVPPPPPSNSNAATAALPPSTFAPPAAAVAGVASANPSGPVEYDSAGLPWDGRIHNKGRTRKNDGTWKLRKGLDPIVAQTVVAELASKRVSVPQPTTTGTIPMPATLVPPHQSAPMPTMQSQAPVAPQWPTPQAPTPYVMPPPPLPPTGGPLTPEQEARAAYGNRQTGMLPELGAPYTPAAPAPVPLPPYGTYPAPLNTNPLPVPPFPGGPAPAMVPSQPVAASMPPAPQPGAVGGINPQMAASTSSGMSPYKALIDKLTAATQNKTLNPAFVAPTVQRFGVPNMGMLGDPAYAGLLPAISQEFDRLIAGGAPSGP